MQLFDSLTLSDGTVGCIEPGAITFEYCQRYVDDYVLVAEDEIRTAMCRFMDSEHNSDDLNAGANVLLHTLMGLAAA